MGNYVLLSDFAPYAIPLAALIVSAAALVYGAMGGRRSSRDREMELLREELKECKSQRSALERENVELMRSTFPRDSG